MAIPAFCGACVWVLVGTLLSQLVFQRADAGVFPGLVAGVWTAWALFQRASAQHDSLLHVPPLATRFPAPPWWLLGATVLALLSMGVDTAQSIQETTANVRANRVTLQADKDAGVAQSRRVDAELSEWQRFKESHHL
jgi:hypothetical protein